MKLTYIIKLTFVLTLLAGCEDFLEETPADQITNDLILTDATSVKQGIFGLYEVLNRENADYHVLFFSLMADEVTVTDTPWREIDNTDFELANFTTEGNDDIPTFWEANYLVIYRANFILEKLPYLNIEDDLKDAFTAEIRFLRAWIYYNLIQLYSDVPLLLNTALESNQSPSRTPESEILNFIVQELEEAIPDLPEAHGSLEESKIRATKAAGQSLLAKAEALKGNWQAVESLATQVIDKPQYALVSDYESLFATREYNAEGIFQIYFGPQNPEPLIVDAYLGVDGYKILFVPTNELVEAFAENDLRKKTSVSESADTPGGFITYKYRDFEDETITQYYIRLAEIYLLRAEARAHLNNLPGALEDINLIRNRAGLADTNASTAEAAFSMIEHERLLELCFEGHRWFDLKRTNRLDQVMSKHLGVFWDSPKDMLLPVPMREMINNPNLAPDNPGYN